MTRPNPRQHAKSEAMAAYRVQMNRAWAAGKHAWITTANLPSLSTVAIGLLTDRLKAKLDALDEALAPAPAEVAHDKPAKAVRGLGVTAASDRGK